jgi:bifunctional non-homologous end joining protein LigD
MARARIGPPAWIKPQLAQLVKAAPDGPGWLHEMKLDGYRMHARIDAGSVKIITRRGNDWTDKYPSIARALISLPTKSGLPGWRTSVACCRMVGQSPST